MIAHSQRVVNHCQVNPTDQLDLQLAMMERIHAQYGVGGWKTYPEWSPDGKGWAMDDENAAIPLIEKARQLGARVVCIHKGIVFPGWDRAASDPADVGIVAKAYPDTTFIVYHSAIEFEPRAESEGPYNPNNTQGTDRLIRTLLNNDLTGKNLYAELGSVWAQVMNDSIMAQHVMGKLLKHFGPDHVLWGSELDLARLAATADRSVSRVSDLERVPRQVRLPRAHARDQSQDLRPQRREAVRRRS